MTRNDYLNDLAAKLSRLPHNERDTAMEFYSEYFEDAESDEAAIESLGSSARLAAQINAEYSARMLEERAQAPQTPDVPETADTKQSDFSTLPSPPQGYTQNTYAANSAAGPAPQNTGQSKSSIGWILAVILGIFALPVALPIAIVAVVLVVVIIVLCISLVAALLGVVGGLIYVGISSLFGIGAFAIGTGSVLIIIGGAVMSLGLAFILIPLLIMLCVWLISAIGKLVSRIFNSLKRRSQKNEEA